MSDAMGREESRADPRGHWPSRAVLLALGLLQGLAAMVLAQLPPNPRAPATEAAAMFVMTAGVFIQMTWPMAGPMPSPRWGAIRTLAVAAGVALLPALSLYWTAVHWAGADAPWAWFMLPLAAFFALPYVQEVGRGDPAPSGHRALYAGMVENGLILAAAGATLVLYTALLVLWAALFGLLGIHEVSRFLLSETFAAPTGGLMWAAGLILARESSTLLRWLRQFAQMLARIMLPLAVVIGASFFAVLPFTGLAPLWDAAGGSRLLLTIAVILVLFINAVYQDGTVPQPAWQRRIVEAGAAMVLLAAGLAVYGTSLRILQHGLTPERVLLLTSVAVALLVGIGYGAAALPVGSAWFGFAQRVNGLAVPLIAFLLLALAGPLLDPVRLSAWDQHRRLVSGTIPAEKFDYGYLWFRLGEAGRARIAALEALEDHPQIEAIRAGIAEAKSFETYYAWTARNATGLRGRRLPTPTGEKPLDEPVAGPAATVTRSAAFNGTGQWDAVAIATVAGAGAKVHWISEPYEWTVGDSPAILVPLGHKLRVSYLEDGMIQFVELSAGDVLRGEPGVAFRLHPDSPTHILVLEEEAER